VYQGYIAYIGKQGLLKAKSESNQYFKNKKLAKNYKDVIEGKHDLYIFCGSSLELMKKILKEYADPPYDASIQFGELAYIWITWLKMDKKYLEKISTDEIIRNEKQNKTFDVYYSLLSKSFEDMYDLLKPNGYLTLTFHNPTFKVRNATIRAGVFAGFEFQKIYHQELARPSAKSLLQPFGSAQGDFYLRFYKPDIKKKVSYLIEIDEIRFENIVVEKTIEIIAKRGEPTPYTIIINAIDPELAKHGFFSKLQTGLDVKSILQNHLNKEFILIPAKLGGTTGKLWWFKETSLVPHLEEVPLSERVEKTVLRKLQQSGKVAFTYIWDAISTEFPNALTSDSVSIKEALKIYANPVSSGYWLIKPNVTEQSIIRDHSEIIRVLAKIGKSRGFKIWIGKLEQAHKILTKGEGETLGQFVDLKDLSKIKNIKNRKIVENMDVHWIENDTIKYIFEVEATTAMTESLNRGSNLDFKVPKYLLIPENREH